MTTNDHTPLLIALQAVYLAADTIDLTATAANGRDVTRRAAILCRRAADDLDKRRPTCRKTDTYAPTVAAQSTSPASQPPATDSSPEPTKPSAANTVAACSRSPNHHLKPIDAVTPPDEA